MEKNNERFGRRRFSRAMGVGVVGLTCYRPNAASLVHCSSKQPRETLPLLTPYDWKGPYAEYRESHKARHRVELCFAIKPTWFTSGRILVRAPEMLRSENQLIYDDHLPAIDPSYVHQSSTWKVTRTSGVLETVNRSREKGAFSIQATPVSDGVRLQMVLENTTDKPMVNVAMAFCVIGYEAPEFSDHSLERTFIHTKTGFKALNQTDHKSNSEQGTFYWVEGRERQACGIEQYYESSDSATDGLVLVKSVNRNHIAGIGFDKSNVIFATLNNYCFHADPYFGRIEPGHQKSAYGQIFLFRGDLEEGLSRYRVRFTS